MKSHSNCHYRASNII